MPSTSERIWLTEFPISPLFVYQICSCVILNSQLDQCLLFIRTQHMGEQLMNTKKGYKATYTYPCGLLSKNRMYKTLHNVRSHAIRISLLVAASCLLSGRHPTPCVARQRLAVRQRMTRSPGSQRQSQCAWKILEGASRSCSSSLPLGLDGWSQAAVLCCTRGVRPCAVPGLFGSHRGTTIFESIDIGSHQTER